MSKEAEKYIEDNCIVDIGKPESEERPTNEVQAKATAEAPKKEKKQRIYRSTGLPITARQKRFCEIYAETLDGSKAAKKTYKNRHSAPDNLSKPAVRTYIQSIWDRQGLNERFIGAKLKELISDGKISASDRINAMRLTTDVMGYTGKQALIHADQLGISNTIDVKSIVQEIGQEVGQEGNRSTLGQLEANAGKIENDPSPANESTSASGSDDVK